MHGAVWCSAKYAGLQRQDISSKYNDRGKSVPEIHGTLHAELYDGPVLY